MNFKFRHINRITYPKKHLLICEDDINCQKRFLEHFNQIFDPQGEVQVSVVPGALAAAAIISYCKVDLIVLDHDMPEGNGADLLKWLKSQNSKIPVITASGLHHNNIAMAQLGAAYCHFNKDQVINGDADDIIKNVLSTNPSKVESYPNTLCHNFIAHRWWAHPDILVGGSILDAADYQHLKNTYGINYVINLETEHSDLDKGIENLCEERFPDNGAPIDCKQIVKIIHFAQEGLKHGKIYVHCQMGSSRSPAAAYAILRTFGLSKEEALKQIAEARPEHKPYGHHPYHQSYINSIDKAFDDNDDI